MKKTLFLFLVLLLSVTAFAQKMTGEKVLDMMYKQYHGKWHRNITFIKTTEQYAYEQVNNTQTWYEAIEFPGNLRLDIGDTKNGNLIIFHNDSLFKYQDHQNISARADVNSLVFLLGGMYFYNSDSVKKRFENYYYDLSKMCATKWMGKEIYIIGADSVKEKVNQLWVDKENLLVHRIIEYDSWNKLDFVFEDHKKLEDGSWTETKVTIYQDDKKAQVEYYKDIQINQQLDSRLFNPKRMEIANHWYQPGNNK